MLTQGLHQEWSDLQTWSFMPLLGKEAVRKRICTDNVKIAKFDQVLQVSLFRIFILYIFAYHKNDLRK